MRAVRFAGDGAVRVGPVAEPVLKDPADAIVRVRRAAICGTDLHTVAHGTSLGLGAVLGHEFAGEITALGPAVAGHRIGDLVVGGDFTACGTCWWCRRGDHWECGQRRFFGTGGAFGPPLDGAQAELVRVPFADTVLRAIPDGVSLDAAVFLGDTLATGYAAVQRGGLVPGDCVAVLGGGPVGQLTSLVAQACGAASVVLAEPIAGRRDLAVREGALAVAPENARELIDRLTEGRGADVVIDAIGGPAGLDLALATVRRRGTVVSVGVHTGPAWPMPVADAFAGELTLRFVIGDFLRDADPICALVRSGAVDPTVVASETVPLDAASEAYRRMGERRTLKTLIAL
ncbi:alcohol dehydrogenase catalytic domain-containing protein [Cryptosporangium sp. NPDC051539]|uniref:alcohol dehydrogenase catalytic domain-containing protein n=1 Tax=Cryptosporangium sp. NPDC051539 TaxID=3363962 RepID=UPI0037B723A9